MLDHHVHRVLVGEDRVLAGLITTFDMLRVMSRAGAPRPGVTKHTGYSRGDFR
jgi:CBS domain-containing protein